MDRDWSNLVDDIGHVILSKLPEFVDRVRFGAVCQNWKSIAKQYHQLTGPSLPMIFVPGSEGDTQRRFYSLSAGRVYPNVILSGIPFKRCCGSSYGWLAFMEEDLSVTLINPFRFGKTILHLPQMKPTPPEVVTEYVDTIFKLIMTPDSTPENYTAVVIYGGLAQLATIRSGDSSWTNLADNKVLIPGRMVCDIVFHKGLVYGIGQNFAIFSININSRPILLRSLKGRDPYLPMEKQFIRSYITESTSGDLYVLSRRRSGEHFATKLFKAFKLELEQEDGGVVRVTKTKTLDGDSIFMNELFSAAVKVSDLDWCESDSVYYTDDYGGFDQRPDSEIEDSGIYNLKEKSMTKLYLRDPNHRDRPIPTALLVQLPLLRDLEYFN